MQELQDKELNHNHTSEDHSRPAATATSGNLHLSGHYGSTGILDQQKGNSQCKIEKDKFHPKPISHKSNHKLPAMATTMVAGWGFFEEIFERRSDENVRDRNIGD